MEVDVCPGVLRLFWSSRDRSFTWDSLRETTMLPNWLGSSTKGNSSVEWFGFPRAVQHF